MLLSEYFTELEKIKTQEDKISYLRWAHEQTKSTLIPDIMRINFDHRIKMNLPDGDPPYKRQADRPMGYEQTNLRTELKRFYIWMDPNINIKNIKKESLFIEMLEGLHISEAEILLAAKSRKLSTLYKSITRELIDAAYPGCLPPPSEVPVEVVMEEKKLKKTKKELASLEKS